MNPAASPRAVFPSPAAVADRLRSHEVALRCRHLPEQLASTVLRYGAVVGSVITSFPSLARGMEHARFVIDEHEERRSSFPSGRVIFAEQLTGGKGRFQRAWHAPPGGVWMTLVLVNTLLPSFSRLLPLAAGVACCECVREFGLDARLKWVNDVRIAGKKVAGVLLETVFGKTSGEEYILVGIGLNVNNGHFPAELADSAVSMCHALGRPLDVGETALTLLVKLAWNYGLLCRQEHDALAERPCPLAATGSDVVARWRSLSDSIGRHVAFGHDLQRRPSCYEARTLAVDEQGALHMRLLEDGAEVTEEAGEIVYLD